MNRTNSESLTRFFFTTKKGIVDTANLPKTTQISPFFLMNSIFLQLGFGLIILVLLFFAIHRVRYRFKVYAKNKKSYQIEWNQQILDYQLQKSRRTTDNQRLQQKQSDSDSVSFHSQQEPDSQLVQPQLSNQRNGRSKRNKQSKQVKILSKKRIGSQQEIVGKQQEELSTGLDLQDAKQIENVSQDDQSDQILIQPNPEEDSFKKMQSPVIAPKQKSNLDMMMIIEQKIIRICPILIVFIIANNSFNTSFQINLCFFLTIILFCYGNLKQILDQAKTQKCFDQLACLMEFKKKNKGNKQQKILCQQKINQLIEKTQPKQSKQSSWHLKIAQITKQNIFFLPVFYTCFQVILGDFQVRYNL